MRETYHIAFWLNFAFRCTEDVMSTMAFQYCFVSTKLVDKPFTWKHGLGHELVVTHAKIK